MDQTERNSSRWLSQKKQRIRDILVHHPRQLKISTRDLKYFWVFMELLGHVPVT